MKLLDKKLKKIKNGTFTLKDFIIADAKDADMGFGIQAPGNIRDLKGVKTNNFLNKEDYIKKIVKMTRSELVDVMLMSASTAEKTFKMNLFKNSKVTPAIRFNDSSDIWALRHGNYNKKFGHPFRTSRLDLIKKYCNLGLYAITFCNDRDLDIYTLNKYKEFRIEANKYKFKHFLEVFNPNQSIGLNHKELGKYINDCIIKTLAGVVELEMPLFLKIVFNGKAAIEELANYDPKNLIVGVLGGSKGTTRDTFELVKQSSQSGAKVALFGRKINLSEDPQMLVYLMREVVNSNITTKDAVKKYHSDLKRKKLFADTKLEDDIEITEKSLRQ